MKAAASLALLATLATACTMPRRGSHVVTALGAVTAIGGMAVASGSQVDSDMDGINENPLNDDLGAALGGGILLLAGVALIVAGVTSQPPPEEQQATAVPPPRQRPASVTWTPAVMPYDYVPGDPPGKTVATPPPPPRATLPEVATTDVVLRMAQQARAAVERGNCDAAWLTWGSIHAQDQRYAVALASGPVLAPCPPRPIALDD